MHALGLTFEILELIEKIGYGHGLKGDVNIGMQRGLDLNPTIFIDWFAPTGERQFRIVVAVNLKFLDGVSEFSLLKQQIVQKFEAAIRRYN